MLAGYSVVIVSPLVGAAAGAGGSGADDAPAAFELAGVPELKLPASTCSVRR